MCWIKEENIRFDKTQFIDFGTLRQDTEFNILARTLPDSTNTNVRVAPVTWK